MSILAHAGVATCAKGVTEERQRLWVHRSLLDAIITQMKRTNAPPEQQAITDIERQQLIAVWKRLSWSSKRRS